MVFVSVLGEELVECFLFVGGDYDFVGDVVFFEGM